MRDWAGSDGVRGEVSGMGGEEVREDRRLEADGSPESTVAGPQGRRSLTQLHLPPRARTAAALQMVLLAIAAVALIAATPALHRLRPSEQIIKILADGPHHGECDRCHTMHGADMPEPQPNLLLAPDDNSLCLTCHDTPWAGGSFGGPGLYNGTGHGSSLTMVWPGPDPQARIEIDAAGKCLNCHDPHGWSDASGLIPFMTLQREERLCLTCHDGHPAATNIQVDLQKPFRHPVTDLSGRHTGPDEALPEDFGVTPLNKRHSECQDCHDPHVGRPDVFPPAADEASKTTLGASRVTVLNGVAGSIPTYSFVSGADTLAAPTDEAMLCFKCHSSWTAQPAGQTDLARVLNPANPSYHPVEARGRNSGIQMLAFVSGWSEISYTRCDDCHGSDFGSARGPHGSVYRYILKAPYTASPTERAMDPGEICFKCHAYDVYANPSSSEMALGASRFNPPGQSEGHAFHVGGQSVPCYACHVTHGSTTQPHLIVTGRNPGITSYTETSTGGTCSPTCHGSESYTLSYAR